MKTLTERIHEVALNGADGPIEVTLSRKECVKLWALLVIAKDWHNSDPRQMWPDADDREEGLLRAIVTEIIDYESEEAVK